MCTNNFKSTNSNSNNQLANNLQRYIPSNKPQKTKLNEKQNDKNQTRILIKEFAKQIKRRQMKRNVLYIT